MVSKVLPSSFPIFADRNCGCIYVCCSRDPLIFIIDNDFYVKIGEFFSLKYKYIIFVIVLTASRLPISMSSD